MHQFLHQHGLVDEEPVADVSASHEVHLRPRVRVACRIVCGLPEVHALDVEVWPCHLSEVAQGVTESARSVDRDLHRVVRQDQAPQYGELRRGVGYGSLHLLHDGGIVRRVELERVAPVAGAVHAYGNPAVRSLFNLRKVLRLHNAEVKALVYDLAVDFLPVEVRVGNERTDERLLLLGSLRVIVHSDASNDVLWRVR